DPDERFQNAHDLKLQLQWIADAGSQAGVPAPVAKRRRSRERLGWLGAAALPLPLTAALAVTLGHFREKPALGLVARFQFSLPENVRRTAGGAAQVSPDGGRIASVAFTADSTAHLFVRRLDSLSTEMLSGSEGASTPFWSPDSKSVAFFAGGKL